MDRPMTRRGCLIGALLWAVVMTAPLCALVLAVRGEIGWRRGGFVEDRLWLVNETGAPGEAARGLAYSAARTIGRPAAPDGPICVRTRVYFWLWQGQSERLEYCDCYVPRPGPPPGYDSTGSCP
jgi:hypothetical protein